MACTPCIHAPDGLKLQNVTFTFTPDKDNISYYYPPFRKCSESNERYSFTDDQHEVYGSLLEENRRFNPRLHYSNRNVNSQFMQDNGNKTRPALKSSSSSSRRTRILDDMGPSTSCIGRDVDSYHSKSVPIPRKLTKTLYDGFNFEKCYRSYDPVDEEKFYKNVVLECRKALESNLIDSKRRKVEKVYFKALEGRFKSSYNNLKQQNEKTTSANNFRPALGTLHSERETISKGYMASNPLLQQHKINKFSHLGHVNEKNGSIKTRSHHGIYQTRVSSAPIESVTTRNPTGDNLYKSIIRTDNIQTHIQLLRDLKSEIVQLTRTWKNLRIELSTVSPSMEDRKELNQQYFSVLDQLNKKKLLFQACKTYLREKYKKNINSPQRILGQNGRHEVTSSGMNNVNIRWTDSSINTRRKHHERTELLQTLVYQENSFNESYLEQDLKQDHVALQQDNIENESVGNIDSFEENEKLIRRLHNDGSKASVGFSLDFVDQSYDRANVPRSSTSDVSSELKHAGKVNYSSSKAVDESDIFEAGSSNIGYLHTDKERHDVLYERNSGRCGAAPVRENYYNNNHKESLNLVTSHTKSDEPKNIFTTTQDHIQECEDHKKVDLSPKRKRLANIQDSKENYVWERELEKEQFCATQTNDVGQCKITKRNTSDKENVQIGIVEYQQKNMGVEKGEEKHYLQSHQVAQPTFGKDDNCFERALQMDNSYNNMINTHDTEDEIFQLTNGSQCVSLSHTEKQKSITKKLKSEGRGSRKSIHQEDSSVVEYDTTGEDPIFSDSTNKESKLFVQNESCKDLSSNPSNASDHESLSKNEFVNLCSEETFHEIPLTQEEGSSMSGIDDIYDSFLEVSGKDKLTHQPNNVDQGRKVSNEDEQVNCIENQEVAEPLSTRPDSFFPSPEKNELPDLQVGSTKNHDLEKGNADHFQRDSQKTGKFTRTVSYPKCTQTCPTIDYHHKETTTDLISTKDNCSQWLPEEFDLINGTKRTLSTQTDLGCCNHDMSTAEEENSAKMVSNLQKHNHQVRQVYKNHLNIVAYDCTNSKNVKENYFSLDSYAKHVSDDIVSDVQHDLKNFFKTRKIYKNQNNGFYPSASATTANQEEERKRVENISNDLKNISMSFFKLLDITRNRKHATNVCFSHHKIDVNTSNLVSKGPFPFNESASRHSYILLNHYSDGLSSKIISAVYNDYKFFVDIYCRENNTTLEGLTLKQPSSSLIHISPKGAERMGKVNAKSLNHKVSDLNNKLSDNSLRYSSMSCISVIGRTEHTKSTNSDETCGRTHQEIDGNLPEHFTPITAEILENPNTAEILENTEQIKPAYLTVKSNNNSDNDGSIAGSVCKLEWDEYLENLHKSPSIEDDVQTPTNINDSDEVYSDSPSIESDTQTRKSNSSDADEADFYHASNGLASNLNDPINQTMNASHIVSNPNYTNQTMNASHIVSNPNYTNQALNDFHIVSNPSYGNQVLNDSRIVSNPNYTNQALNDSHIVSNPSYANQTLNDSGFYSNLNEAYEDEQEDYHFYTSTVPFDDDSSAEKNNSTIKGKVFTSTGETFSVAYTCEQMNELQLFRQFSLDDFGVGSTEDDTENEETLHDHDDGFSNDENTEELESLAKKISSLFQEDQLDSFSTSNETHVKVNGHRKVSRTNDIDAIKLSLQKGEDLNHDVILPTSIFKTIYSESSHSSNNQTKGVIPLDEDNYKSFTLFKRSREEGENYAKEMGGCDSHNITKTGNCEYASVSAEIESRDCDTVTPDDMEKVNENFNFLEVDDALNTDNASISSFENDEDIVLIFDKIYPLVSSSECFEGVQSDGIDGKQSLREKINSENPDINRVNISNENSSFNWVTDFEDRDIQSRGEKRIRSAEKKLEEEEKRMKRFDRHQFEMDMKKDFDAIFGTNNQSNNQAMQNAINPTLDTWEKFFDESESKFQSNKLQKMKKAFEDLKERMKAPSDVKNNEMKSDAKELTSEMNSNVNDTTTTLYRDIDDLKDSMEMKMINDKPMDEYGEVQLKAFNSEMRKHTFEFTFDDLSEESPVEMVNSSEDQIVTNLACLSSIDDKNLDYTIKSTDVTSDHNGDDETSDIGETSKVIKELIMDTTDSPETKKEEDMNFKKSSELEDVDFPTSVADENECKSDNRTTTLKKMKRKDTHILTDRRITCRFCRTKNGQKEAHMSCKHQGTYSGNSLMSGTTNNNVKFKGVRVDIPLDTGETPQYIKNKNVTSEIKSSGYTLENTYGKNTSSVEMEEVDPSGKHNSEEVLETFGSQDTVDGAINNGLVEIKTNHKIGRIHAVDSLNTYKARTCAFRTCVDTEGHGISNGLPHAVNHKYFNFSNGYSSDVSSKINSLHSQRDDIIDSEDEDEDGNTENRSNYEPEEDLDHKKFSKPIMRKDRNIRDKSISTIDKNICSGDCNEAQGPVEFQGKGPPIEEKTFTFKIPGDEIGDSKENEKKSSYNDKQIVITVNSESSLNNGKNFKANKYTVDEEDEKTNIVVEENTNSYYEIDCNIESDQQNMMLKKMGSETRKSSNENAYAQNEDNTMNDISQGNIETKSNEEEEDEKEEGEEEEELNHYKESKLIPLAVSKKEEISTKMMDTGCTYRHSSQSSYQVKTSGSYDQFTSAFTTMDFDDFKEIAIIDNGSGSIKSGLVTNDRPYVTPSIFGTANYQKVFPGEKEQERWYGDEANRLRGILKLKYPIEHGIIKDWDGMEKLWDHVFQTVLKIDPSEHPIIQTETPCNPKKNQERMLEIMMETYDVPAYYVVVQPVMSLYDCGRTTGIVLDSGDSVTNAVPIYEGYGLPHAVKRMNLGGRDLTGYLQQILSEKGTVLRTSGEFEISREIKESQCFVATDPLDFDHPGFTKYHTNYTLPDGQTISLDSERIRCPEILFQPSLIGHDLPGMHQMLYDSIMATDVDLRLELMKNIIVSGGSTLFPGLTERLHKELNICCASKKRNAIKIHAAEERQFSVWRGASIFASLSTFEQMVITRDEYFDVGRHVVHLKCF